MIKKILLGIFIITLFSKTVAAETNQYVEVFDIKNDKVIMQVNSDIVLQQEAKKFLEGITGVYVKFNPIPKEGYMIKVPLEPSIMVENQWFNDLVNEVIIIFTSEEDPYIMIFDDENRAHFLTSEGDLVQLLLLVNFNR